MRPREFSAMAAGFGFVIAIWCLLLDGTQVPAVLGGVLFGAASNEFLQLIKEKHGN